MQSYAFLTDFVTFMKLNVMKASTQMLHKADTNSTLTKLLAQEIRLDKIKTVTLHFANK